VTHRAIEVLIGLGLLGLTVYHIYSGRIIGRSYTRDESPFLFWTSIVLTVVIALVFLVGTPTWRA
jgi:hypothetical protein